MYRFFFTENSGCPQILDDTMLSDPALSAAYIKPFRCCLSRITLPYMKIEVFRNQVPIVKDIPGRQFHE
jgi:hypothetical protein